MKCSAWEKEEEGGGGRDGGKEGGGGDGGKEGGGEGGGESMHVAKLGRPSLRWGKTAI